MIEHFVQSAQVAEAEWLRSFAGSCPWPVDVGSILTSMMEMEEACEEQPQQESVVRSVLS